MEMETEMGGHHGGGDNDRNLILIFDMERGKILDYSFSQSKYKWKYEFYK